MKNTIEIKKETIRKILYYGFYFIGSFIIFTKLGPLALFGIYFLILSNDFKK